MTWWKPFFFLYTSENLLLHGYCLDLEFQYSKVVTFRLTFPKLILVHLVLLVKRPTEAVPPEATPDVDWSATQFTVMVVLAAAPDSMTQTSNPLLVTSAVHTTADPWTLGGVPTWLIEATTRTLAEPENLSGKTTSWQRVFEDVTFRASFPCWMELPVEKRTNKFMRPLEKSDETTINSGTHKSDQCQISPAASPEILHHTVRRTWLSIAYSDERWLYYEFSLYTSFIHFLFERLRGCTFWDQEWKT